MLYWAGTIAVCGMGAYALLESRVGAGVDGTARAILFGTLGLAVAMAFTHWLCKRNRWR